MATRYFDPTNAADLRLLPSSYRDKADLAGLAEIVEADVINYYTASAPDPAYTTRMTYRAAVKTGENVYVFLRGYREDAADAEVDADLKTALRLTIALVLRWRLAQWDYDPMLTGKSTPDGVSISLRTDAADAFPEGWDRFLAPFDTREPAWGF